MTRLIVHYDGRGLEEKIAKVSNKLAYAHRQECLSEPLDPSTVRLWFEGPDYEPEMFAAVELDSGAIAGYAWAWVNVEEEPAPISWVNLYVDPELPQSDLVQIARLLLSWARHSLESWQETRGLVELRLGPLGGLIYSTVLGIVGCGFDGEKTSGYLMLSPRDGFKANVPAGFVIEEARPDRNKDEARALVDVFNDSFSIYEDFWPWRLERAVRYYKELFEKRDAVVLLARDENGQPAGFIEVYTHPTLCGRSVGYISLLAVRRHYQGKGLGSSLLATAEKWLRDRNATHIYLYAVPRASLLYLKLGYKIASISVKVRIPIYCIPSEPYDGITSWT